MSGLFYGLYVGIAVFLVGFLVAWMEYVNLLLMVEGVMLMGFFFMVLGFYSGLESGDFLMFFSTMMVMGGAYGLSLLVSLSKDSGEASFLSNSFN